MTMQMAYPYTGRVGLGTLWKNAGYVQLPYVRPTRSRCRSPTRARVRIRARRVFEFCRDRHTPTSLGRDSVGVTDAMQVDTALTRGYVVTADR